MITNFKLPISYNKKKMVLNENIVKDLELIETIDPSSNSIYQYICQPTTILGKTILKDFVTNYTTDIQFLRETQLLLKNYKSIDENKDKEDEENKDKENKDKENKDKENKKNNNDNIIKIWNEIKNDNGFKEKYQFIHWPFWEFLNNSEIFLQLLSVYNLSSPIISFFVPFIILIIPFFILQIKGISLTFNEYIEVLKTISANHSIGKLFTKFNSVNMDEKIYLLVSAFFYIFSIYQNFLTCVYFNQNMCRIHEYFRDIRKYAKYSIENMNNFLNYTSNSITYSEFNARVKNTISTLTKFCDNTDFIGSYKLSFKKITSFGSILKNFYELHNDDNYNEAFLYSFGFNGYIENMEGLIKNIRTKKINFCKFKKESKVYKKEFKEGKQENEDKESFDASYYATLIDQKPVLNDINLNKNIVITGPNASGKTTILKSTLINIIISQQFGCGFYKKANINPFKFIHCYLNIPDTSGRDSLFQAESRRCKDIIDLIQNNKKDRHFCVFDELYSGTNPTEAVITATSFMNYLVKFKNVKCILTTHFIDLCKNLENNKAFVNYMMKTEFNKDKISFNYNYKLTQGISFVQGGIKVLKDMNYPKEIIDFCNSYS